jgi:hypothetical protein
MNLGGWEDKFEAKLSSRTNSPLVMISHISIAWLPRGDKFLI